MRGVKRTVPLYIECRRATCGRLREVNRPSLQRKGGYCSHRCAAIDLQNIAKADHVRAGQASATVKRNQIRARLRGMTSLEAFMDGYRKGLQSKWRSLRRRYVLTRRTE